MQIKQRQVLASLPPMPDLHPLLARLYAARGITDIAEMQTKLQDLVPFSSLMSIDKACLRLARALQKEERILIIGDFDADGATSTALAICALKSFGAKHVEYLVPNRFEFGYGLTPGIVDVAHRWQPQLIITVDNGIASFDGVTRANDLGIDVLITDHHLPAEHVPEACAIVNPNQEGCTFPSKSIAGVGVIFYVMLALRRHLLNIGWFSDHAIEEPNMSALLDLVALGTVADVVALDKNNRILVRQGLMRMRQGLCRPGIKALIEIAGRCLSRLRETDLGFAVAPRLNAAGRLDDMSLGIACLCAPTEAQARVFAEELDSLNKERRQIEMEMKEQALVALDKLAIERDSLPHALCLFDKTWHQGVIGIVAGRLKDRFHRPVFAFAKVCEAELKGSARSIAGLNIRDALAAVDKDNPGMITKFGGHAMAAGLSMRPEQFDAFNLAICNELKKHIDLTLSAGTIITDGPLEPNDISLDNALLIQQAGPWGSQFPEPLFDNQFEVLDQRLVGQHHLKMTLMPINGTIAIDAIAFNVDLQAWPNHRAKLIHAAYKLDCNVYQGRSRLQLLIEAMVLTD